MLRRRTAVVLAVALLGLLLSVVNAVATPGVVAAVPSGPSGPFGYTAVTPCRLVDTRSAGGALAADAVRQFNVVAGGGGQGGSPGCSAPAGAVAVEVAVTAVNPAGDGFLRLFASGTSVPTATFLNYTTGRSITNTGAVEVATGVTPELTVKNFVGATQVVVDLLGYYASGTGLNYVPLTSPCRVADTRVGAPLSAGAELPLQVAGAGTNFAVQGGKSGGCGLPATATAVEVTVTAVGPAGDGFVRLGRNDGTAPNATFVNYTSGTSITNTGAVPLNPAVVKQLAVKNVVGATHLVVDVQGYFSSTKGTGYQPLTPCRVVDTRRAGGALRAGTTRAVQVGGVRGQFAGAGAAVPEGCGVPQGATAVQAVVTAVSPTANGFVRAFPHGKTIPTATFLNYTSARSIANAGIITLSRQGLLDLDVTSFVADTQLVVDVLGYFEAPAQSFTVEQVDAGDSHTCALYDQGSVRCWGDNARGQMGSATLPTSNVPVQAPAPGPGLPFPVETPRVQLSAGSTSTCAVKSYGIAECWGSNDHGELGRGTPPSGQIDPAAGDVVGLTDVLQVSVGYKSACALKADRHVWCWGRNVEGQLGNGTTVDSSTPVEVSGVTDAVQVGVGDGFACARRALGGVLCWGTNLNGQLTQQPGVLAGSTVPVTIQGPLSIVVQLSVGRDGVCVVNDVGATLCWGRNQAGQTGSAPTPNVSFPSGFGGLPGVLQLAGGADHFCALVVGGEAVCWGDNFAGQLGDGSGVSGPSPVDVVLNSAPFSLPYTGLSDLSSGSFHSCALGGGNTGGTAADKARCWGFNFGGQLGDGSNTNAENPVLVSNLP